MEPPPTPPKKKINKTNLRWNKPQHCLLFIFIEPAFTQWHHYKLSFCHLPFSLVYRSHTACWWHPPVKRQILLEHLSKSRYLAKIFLYSDDVVIRRRRRKRRIWIYAVSVWFTSWLELLADGISYFWILSLSHKKPIEVSSRKVFLSLFCQKVCSTKGTNHAAPV